MDPSPEKDSLQPARPKKWLVLLVLAAFAVGMVTGIFAPAFKRVREWFSLELQTEGERVPVLLGGKIVYKTKWKTKTIEKKGKETLVIRSGISVGVAQSLTTGSRSLWTTGDLFPLLNGTVQAYGSYQFPSTTNLQGDLFVGAGYKLLF